MKRGLARVAGTSLLATATALTLVTTAHAQTPPAAAPAPTPAAAPPAPTPPPAPATAPPPAAPPPTTSATAAAPSPTAAPGSTPVPPPPGPSAPPATQPPASEMPANAAPPPATGFQMAFRFGLSFPMGDATAEPLDSLGARYAWQVPLALDIGAKLGPSIFVGGYLLFAFGAEGSDALVESLCDDDDDDLANDVSCDASTLRLGLEVQYHFMPGEKTNVWVGYGAGFESSSQSIRDSQQGYAEATTVSGITVAQLSVGADFRSRLFGVGPYGELALGRFNHSRTEMNSVETAAGDIASPAWHAWFSLGLRMILFP